MKSNLTIPMAVSNGIAMLDELRPNWRDEVSLEPGRFDIESCSRCVIGQLSDGRYTDYLMDLMSDAEAAGYDYAEDLFAFAATYGFDHFKAYTSAPLDEPYDTPYRQAESYWRVFS